MKRLALSLAVAAIAGSAPLAGQTASDSAAIRATALDYAESWYAGDTARMSRALHPDLAKRIVRNRAGGGPVLSHMTSAQLVAGTARGFGRETPAASRQADVVILDIFNTVASARVTMHDWIDYMHLAKWNGRWVIVNVLWEMK